MTRLYTLLIICILYCECQPLRYMSADTHQLSSDPANSSRNALDVRISICSRVPAVTYHYL